MDLFRSEADGQTALLTEGLLALEGSGVPSPAALESLMRAAHSLKGAARIVGLDAAVRVAHAMEDCFVAAQKGKLVLQPGHVDILLRGVDLLVQVSQLAEAELESWQADHAAEVDALVADLTAVKSGVGSDSVRGEGEAPVDPEPDAAPGDLRSELRQIQEIPAGPKSGSSPHSPLPTPHSPPKACGLP